MNVLPAFGTLPGGVELAVILLGLLVPFGGDAAVPASDHVLRVRLSKARDASSTGGRSGR